MKSLLLSVFLVNSVSFVRAQELHFDWYEGACLLNGIIDSTKANYMQVQNVHYTLMQSSEMSQPYLAYAPKDTVYLDVKNIRSECASFLRELERMEYPKGDYWTNIKKARMADLEEQCLLREKAVIALTNPKTLKGTPYSESCSGYITALQKGGKTLLYTWKEMHKKEVSQALDPVSISAVFEQHWNSPERELWARIEILRYGWWNCVWENRKVWFDENEYNKEFKKLMISVHSNCY